MKSLVVRSEVFRYGLKFLTNAVKKSGTMVTIDFSAATVAVAERPDVTAANSATAILVFLSIAVPYYLLIGFDAVVSP